MKLTYDIKDKPKFGQLIAFAIQQLLAIMAATLVVPVIIGHGMSPAAALFGAGIGTMIYVLFTKAKSPVFLGSSFAFINSMFAAFAGGVSMALGYVGLILGAVFAGLIYVIIALIVKFVGVKWIYALMPAVVIGPTVSIIGLSLAGNAVGDLQKGGVTKSVLQWLIEDGLPVQKPVAVPVADARICILIGLITLAVVVLCSTFGKKMARLIPFIIGILAGYAVSAIFTIIGNAADIEALKVLNFGAFTALLDNGKVAFSTFFSVPDFTFLKAIEGISEVKGAYIASIAVAYIPVAFVVFAEHVADHRNISSIIDKDLLEEPGLHRTLLGDGVGSAVGAFFGGCPNTTYGESIACVAITGNASVVTIIATAIGAVLISFLSPFVAFVNSIPPCVMGGVCVALYGFIAVSGLKMIQDVDLGDNRNLFVVSSILILGIGGLVLNFGKVTITSVAVALIIGILVNVMCKKKAKTEE